MYDLYDVHGGLYDADLYDVVLYDDGHCDEGCDVETLSWQKPENDLASQHIIARIKYQH